MKNLNNLIRKYNLNLPRYTSYPTIPTWNQRGNMDNNTYKEILSNFKEEEISLYIHIPFCMELCHFCGCNTHIKSTDVYNTGLNYIHLLEKECELITKNWSSPPKLAQIHFGGGTPNYLSPDLFKELFKIINNYFTNLEDIEISIEFDPRHSSEELINTLCELNVNRVSMGIQDFNPNVQKNINRIQPFHLVKEVFTQFRKKNIPSINFDLIYGLPGQTQETFEETVDKVCSLKPDRIALYSFAYIPTKIKHQKVIAQNKLPNPDEKLAIFLNSRTQFLNAGYVDIGLDHFALPHDQLTKNLINKKKIFRNFMGYALKETENMLGIGTSAISYINNHFIQNHKSLISYEKLLNNNQIPCENGHTLNKDDLSRKWVIDQLMCHLKVSKIEFERKFSKNFDTTFKQEVNRCQKLELDNLVEINESFISVTDIGKNFLRNIANCWDKYFHDNTVDNNFSKSI